MITLPAARGPERWSRIIEKLAAAAAAPRARAMFGAAAHGYRLGPALPGSEVATFERHHRTVLPEAYRTFVTTVGNGGPGRYGGAGPFYGLLPLSRWGEALIEPAQAATLATAFPADPELTYGADWLADLGLDDDGTEWFPGAIALGHLGCGDMAVLVVSGPGRGRVAYTSWSVQAPVYAPDPDFATWYERWLDAALRGDPTWA